ncbi:MAG: glutaredoxin family protein [Planctomycetes bacterium]|nr:glutaredoxin family protein [Planctomycetota bacterium]
MDELFAQLKKDAIAARLEVYVSTFCFDCRRLKGLLDRHEVAYDTVDIGAVDGAAERLERETGKRGVPFVLVNDSKWVRGYHLDQPGRLNPEVFVNELAAAL